MLEIFALTTIIAVMVVTFAFSCVELFREAISKKLNVPNALVYIVSSVYGVVVTSLILYIMTEVF